MRLSNYKQAAEANPEGFTMDLEGNVLDLHTGYAVGIVRPQTGLPAFNGGPAERLCVGFWCDPETGEGHLDVVLIVQDRIQALLLAREHGQKAVYGFAEQAAIPTETEEKKA